MIVTERTTELADLVVKVQAGERLGLDDGGRPFQSQDVRTTGQMADLGNTRLHGGGRCFF